MEARTNAERVTGVFASDEAAERVIAALTRLGVGRQQWKLRTRTQIRGVQTPLGQWTRLGGLLGATEAAALEATVLAFPPVSILIAGGTLAAAVTGLTVGATAGLVVATGRHALQSAGRAPAEYELTVTEPNPQRRAICRRVMRVSGAVETSEPTDAEARTTNFRSGFAEVVPTLREHLRSQAHAAGWDDREPWYRFGWQLANRPDFEERDWSDAQDDIEADWTRRHPGLDWDAARPFVREGFLVAQRTTSRSGSGRSRS